MFNVVFFRRTGLQFSSDSLYLCESVRCSTQLLGCLWGKCGSPSTRLTSWVSSTGFWTSSLPWYLSDAIKQTIVLCFILFYFLNLLPSSSSCSHWKQWFKLPCLLLTEIEHPGIFKGRLYFVYIILQNACYSLGLERCGENWRDFTEE